MEHNVRYERPSFDEIIAAIRRTFPIPGNREIGLLPNSFDGYFSDSDITLIWQRIPDWESYEWGRRDITDEEFMALLFSPKSPTSDESILVITDECFRERKGFRVRFGDLLAFAREDYPRLWQPSVAFFQPCDMIFLAEQSRLLVLLFHEGLKAQHAAEIV